MSGVKGAFVSVVNSTTTQLAADGVFNSGTDNYEEVTGYSSITVNVIADQNSAADGLVIYQSSDKTNEDISDSFSYLAASGAVVYTVPVYARYAKVQYTNGGTLQGAGDTFRLQTIYHNARQAGKITAGSTNTVLYDTGGTAIGVTGGSLETTLTDSSGNAIGVTGGSLETTLTDSSGTAIGVAGGSLETTLTDSSGNAIATTAAGDGLVVGIIDDGGEAVSATNNALHVALHAADGTAITETGGALNISSSSRAIYRDIDLDETGILLHAGTSTLYDVVASNEHATLTRYLKIYDHVDAPDAGDNNDLIATIPLYPQTTVHMPFVHTCDDGLGVRATSDIGDTSTGAPGPNEVIVNIQYIAG